MLGSADTTAIRPCWARSAASFWAVTSSAMSWGGTGAGVASIRSSSSSRRAAFPSRFAFASSASRQWRSALRRRSSGAARSWSSRSNATSVLV